MIFKRSTSSNEIVFIVILSGLPIIHRVYVENEFSNLEFI